MKPMLLALSVALLVTNACNKPKQEQQQATATATATEAAAAAADPASEAKTLFRGRCSVCHGQEGAGDGPGAAALNPKPRAFHDAAWQGSVTDDYLAKVIVDGGAAHGKSPAMPGNPDLEGKDEVVKALVAIVRGFKK